jgi:hypothetical protein
MVKVKSLLKQAEQDIEDQDELRVSEWLRTKKNEIRSCQRTLNLLKADLKKVLDKEVDDFAEELLDDRFEY